MTSTRSVVLHPRPTAAAEHATQKCQRRSCCRSEGRPTATCRSCRPYRRSRSPAPYRLVSSFPPATRAASGHAATAPPTAASNFRRPMVTLIRPSRARVRKTNDTRPRACCLNSAALGVGEARTGYRLRRWANRGLNAGTNLRLELQLALAELPDSCAKDVWRYKRPMSYVRAPAHQKAPCDF
jgi:hypothetical protein